LPTFDGATNSYVRDWARYSCHGCCWPSIPRCCDQQFDDGIRAADIKRRAALAPLQSMPGILWAKKKAFPWLGVTVVLGLAFLVGNGWRGES